MAESPTSFETPDGRRFWIRRERGGTPLPGAGAGWPPRGWVCAIEGRPLDINATRPDIRDAIAQATRIGPDQPWLVATARSIEETAG